VKDIDWRAINREDLAKLLSEAKHISSRGLGATTVYHLDHNGRGLLALALPDGYALVVERAPQAKWRRRIDGQQTTPASR